GADERFGARQFRRHGGAGDAVEIEVLLIFRRRRRTHVRAGMATARFLREIRAIEMRTENASSAGVLILQFSTNVKKREMMPMAGDCRRGQQARRAMARMRLTNGAEGDVRAVHEVVIRAAVDVNVDEPGREIAAMEIDALLANRFGRRFLDEVNSSIDDADLAARQFAIGQEHVSVCEYEGAH